MTEAEWLASDDPQAMQAAAIRDIVGTPRRPVTLPSDWLTPEVVALAHAAYDRVRCDHCTGEKGERLAYTGKAQHEPCPECGRGSFRVEDGTLDPLRLSILADALTDVGCTEDIIAHLRSPGPHYRGCWAVDLVLGKS